MCMWVNTQDAAVVAKLLSQKEQHSLRFHLSAFDNGGAVLSFWG